MKNNILLTKKIVKNNSYFQKYIELITKNKSNSKTSINCQNHHIVPRNVFKKCGLCIDSSKTNMVYLSFKNHILAHYYLCLCSNQTWFFQNNFYALCLMLKSYNLSLKEIKDLTPEFEQKLFKLKNIKNKMCSIDQKNDFDFYVSISEQRFQGKTFNVIGKLIGKNPFKVEEKYYDICKKYNLDIIGSKWWNNDLIFYKFFNSNISKSGGIFIISKKYNKRRTLILDTYIKICKRHKLPNVIKKPKDILFNSDYVLFNQMKKDYDMFDKKHWDEWWHNAKKYDSAQRNFLKSYKKRKINKNYCKTDNFYIWYFSDINDSFLEKYGMDIIQVKKFIKKYNQRALKNKPLNLYSKFIPWI